MGIQMILDWTNRRDQWVNLHTKKAGESRAGKVKQEGGLWEEFTEQTLRLKAIDW